MVARRWRRSSIRGRPAFPDTIWTPNDQRGVLRCLSRRRPTPRQHRSPYRSPQTRSQDPIGIRWGVRAIRWGPTTLGGIGGRLLVFLPEYPNYRGLAPASWRWARVCLNGPHFGGIAFSVNGKYRYFAVRNLDGLTSSTMYACGVTPESGATHGNFGERGEAKRPTRVLQESPGRKRRHKCSAGRCQDAFGRDRAGDPPPLNPRGAGKRQISPAKR